MEEEDGQEGAQEEGRKSHGKISVKEIFSILIVVTPDQPGNITECTDSNVDPGKLNMTLDSLSLENVKKVKTGRKRIVRTALRTRGGRVRKDKKKCKKCS